MRYGRFGVVVAWALTLLLLSAPARAQQPSAAHPEMDEKAMAVLNQQQVNKVVRENAIRLFGLPPEL